MESGASRLSIGWVSCGVWWWSGTGGRISTAPNLWYSGSPLVTWFYSWDVYLPTIERRLHPSGGQRERPDF